MRKSLVTELKIAWSRRVILSGLDKAKPIIVLEHQPKQLEELERAGADMQLCGHTHDGQMFPGNLTVKLMWEKCLWVI